MKNRSPAPTCYPNAEPLRSAAARIRCGVHLLCLGVFMLSAVISSNLASAQADDPSFVGLEGLRHWNLYGGPEIAVYAHSGKGNSTSTNITGPRVDPIFIRTGDLGDEISAPERSREDIASFLVGGTFGVLTPGFDVPGRPRFFFDLNVSQPMTTEVELARRGNPGVVTLPRGEALGRPPVREGALTGLGTGVSVQHQGPQVHAGLGRRPGHGG